MDKSPRGFTLIEMLVVVAIISIVATCVTGAVRGAIRQANATKCMANMKNLHTATVAYLADRGVYPRSTSFEYWTLKPKMEGNTPGKKDEYGECHGWVSWVDKNGFRTNGNGKTPWQEEPGDSHAKDFRYPKAVDSNKSSLSYDMNDAIREGSLFKYVGKDHATYVCPTHAAEVRKDKKVARLSYSMNCYFRGGRYAIGPDTIKNSGKTPSVMALFIELDENDGYDGGSQREGESGKGHFVAYGNDCSWDWGDDDKEKIRFTHKKSGGGKKSGTGQNKKGNHSHVVYLDGHVASISIVDADSDSDFFEKLGKGKD